VLVVIGVLDAADVHAAVQTADLVGFLVGLEVAPQDDPDHPGWANREEFVPERRTAT
jgi:hypothetical protein